MISNWFGLVWSDLLERRFLGQAELGQDLFVRDSFATILVEPRIGAIQRPFLIFCGSSSTG
jgi:hypothetical protein